MKRRLLFTFLFATSPTLCLAQPKDTQASVFDALRDPSQFWVVSSVEKLPPEIVALCADRSGRLANPGQKWQETDVVRDNTLPWHRLVWAYTNGEFFVVHYESGGLGHSFKVFIARLRKGDAKPAVIWQGVGVEKKLKKEVAFEKAANQIAAKPDTWIALPSDISLFWKAKPLPATDVFEVTGSEMPEAERELSAVPIVEVSAKHASELVSQLIEASADKKLFMVRGLYLNRHTGGFSVIPMGRELLVSHGSLGKHTVPMTRQALVVRLYEKPKTVYVSCAMAE